MYRGRIDGVFKLKFRNVLAYVPVLCIYFDSTERETEIAFLMFDVCCGCSFAELYSKGLQKQSNYMHVSCWGIHGLHITQRNTFSLKKAYFLNLPLLLLCMFLLRRLVLLGYFQFVLTQTQIYLFKSERYQMHATKKAQSASDNLVKSLLPFVQIREINPPVPYSSARLASSASINTCIPLHFNMRMISNLCPDWLH